MLDYEFLKAITKYASDRLQIVKSTEEWEEASILLDGIETEIKGLPIFLLHVVSLIMANEEKVEKFEAFTGKIMEKFEKLKENEDIAEEIQKEIAEAILEEREEIQEEINKTAFLAEFKNNLFRHITEYLNCPYLFPLSPEYKGYLKTYPDMEICHLDLEYLRYNFREFNEQTFNEYYAEYEQFDSSNLPIKYHIVVSLENFNMSSSSNIMLSNSIRIVSDKDKKHERAIYILLCAMYPYDEYVDGNPFLEEPAYEVEMERRLGESSSFCLEIDCEINKEMVPSQNKEQIEHMSFERIKNVLKILRILKEGDFRQRFIYWRSKTPCDPPYNEMKILFESGSYNTSNPYSLDEYDVKDLQLLFQKYTNNSAKKDFPHSAIYYLDKGVSETDMNDRLVDYTAALESLFVDGKEGIATLLANRTAFFLEKDRQKCKDIYKDIKKAYGFRSNIVHGDYHKIKDELVLKEYCNKIEGYVRLVIAKWIDMVDKGMKRQEIHDSIEDNLFS